MANPSVESTREVAGTVDVTRDSCITPGRGTTTEAERASSTGCQPAAHLIIAIVGKSRKSEGKDIQRHWKRLDFLHFAQLDQLELCDIVWDTSDIRILEWALYGADIHRDYTWSPLLG